jgi:hypothetical protein
VPGDGDMLLPLGLSRFHLKMETESNLRKKKKKKKTPWPESTSEQYRPSDLRLSVKLVPTFADRGMLRGQRDGSPLPYSRISGPESPKRVFK